jgi:hypothetical protein
MTLNGNELIPVNVEQVRQDLQQVYESRNKKLCHCFYAQLSLSKP